MNLRNAIIALFILSVVDSTLEGLPPSIRKVVEEKEALIKELAVRATEMYSNRVESMENCECSRHACSNDFSDASCIDGFKSDDVPSSDLCSSSGRRLDYDNLVIRTPPGTDKDDLSDSLKESICVYKNMLDLVRKSFQGHNGWIYIGTRDGTFVRYPGMARERGLPEQEEDVDKNLGDCRTYDPRIRPWYIGATTGPKDVVILVDKSKSMKTVIDGQQTRWDVAKETVNNILNTFTWTDYINIVTFTTEAKALSKNGEMVEANENNVEEDLKAAFETESAGEESSDYKAGFRKAFELLNEGCRRGTCSNCLKLILFFTDGEMATGNGDESAASSFLGYIEEEQKRLEAQGSRRALIFTYSISDKSNDQLPRQIACRNHGAWRAINPEEGIQKALESYYLFITASGGPENPIWVDPYEDASGLGDVTTVALPFYCKKLGRLPPFFLGVVGHTVLLKDIEGEGMTSDEVLKMITHSSKDCSTDVIDFNNCAIQVFRSVSNERAECPQRFEVNEADPECYQKDENCYRRFNDASTWKQAKDKCESAGGQFATAASIEDLGFLASIAHDDGSWVGLKRKGNMFEWIYGLIPAIDPLFDTDYFGAPKPIKNPEGDCGTVDTRGAKNCLSAKPCDQKRSYICKYSSSRASDKYKVVNPGIDPNSPPSSHCRDKGYSPGLPDSDASKLLSTEVLCPFGDPSISSEDAICCEPEGPLPAYVWVLVAVGALLALSLLVIMVYRKKISEWIKFHCCI